MDGIEVSMRFYIKGKKARVRKANLKKLAYEVARNNLSFMINDALNKQWNLDPETGERLNRTESKSSERVKSLSKEEFAKYLEDPNK